MIGNLASKWEVTLMENLPKTTTLWYRVCNKLTPAFIQQAIRSVLTVQGGIEVKCWCDQVPFRVVNASINNEEQWVAIRVDLDEGRELHWIPLIGVRNIGMTRQWGEGDAS